MTKKSNIAITILCIIEAICYFTPFCITAHRYALENTKYGSMYVRTGSNDVSIWQVGGIITTIAVLLLIITVATAVLYLLKSINNKLSICKAGWIFSFSHTATMAICFYLALQSGTVALNYSLNWMSYIIIALNIVSTILAIISHFQKTNTTGNQANNEQC